MLSAPVRSVDRLLVPLLGSRSLAHRSLERGVDALDAMTDRLAGEPQPPSAARTSDLVTDERAAVAERAEHYLEADEDEVFVGELADPDLRRVQAEVRAKQEIEDEHSN